MSRRPGRYASLSVVAAFGLWHGAALATPDPRTTRQVSLVADTIRGVVFDSLMRRPMAGATVLAYPGGEAAITNDQGQFRIQSHARIQRLAVFDGLLDRTGIGSLLAVLDTTTTERTAINIATPSLATIWARLCPGKVPARGRDGIVLGVARTADSSVRVAGVHVRASWEADALSQVGQGARVVDVRADSIGSFYVCGVPPVTDVFIVGYSLEFSSGSVGLPADSIPLRRQNLILGAPGHTGPIRGVVQDSRRVPIAGATIDIDGFDASLTTDGAGRFAGARIPAGTRSMLVRAVGYSPVLLAIDVLEHGANEVSVQLARNVFLPGVKVTERTRAPVLRQEFDERRRMGVGQFIDTTEINALYNVRSIFQGRPGVTVQGNPPEFTLWVTASGGYCQPAVFLDGFRSDTQILSAISKDRIVAVEIYLRPVEIPARFALVQRSCGAVLVWTRDSFSR
jgi:hypothetical protein